MSRVIKANLPVPAGDSFIQMKAGFTTKSAVKQATFASVISRGMLLVWN